MRNRVAVPRCRHAELVAGDEEVNAIFRRWCFDRRDEVLGE